MSQNEFYINTELNTDGVKQGAKEINQTMEDVANTSANATQEVTQNVNNMSDAINQAANQSKASLGGLGDFISGFKDGLKEGFTINTDGAIDPEKLAKFEAVEAKIQGFKDRVSGAFKALGESIKGNIIGAVEIVKSVFGGMKDFIAGFASGTLEGYNSRLGKATTSTRRFGAAHNSLGGSIKNGLKGLIKYGLGISTLVMLFNKLRKAIVDGMNNLVKYDKTTNASISQLTSALATLKNSLATAFAPILNVVAPILTAFIQKLISVVNTIGMVIAKLTGAKTFTKAIAQQKDYAASLDKTSKAAKKQLLTIDELNQSVSNDNGGGAGGGGSQFETVPITEEATQIADNLKDRFTDFFEPFKKSWEKYGGFVVDSWKYALERVQSLAQSIGRSFMEVWTNGSGEELLGHWLKILGDIGLTIGNIARQFEEAWNTDNIGTQIFQDIFDILNLISGALEECADATAEWAGKLDFYPLLQGVESLLQGIKAVLEPILGVLTTIYTEAILPLVKLIIESALPSILNLIGAALGVIGAILEGLRPTFEWVLKNFIIPIVSSIGALLTKLMDRVAGLLREDIQPAIEKLFNFLNKNILPIMKKILESIKDKVIWGIELLGKAMDNFFDALSGIIDGIMTILGGLIDFITGVFTGDWEKAWNGVKEIFSGIWNTIASICESVVNYIVDMINSLSFDVPDWVPEIGGRHVGFNLKHVSIPRLATGTVVPRGASEFMAVLGDNNKETEVVSPLSTIQQAVAEVMEGYLAEIAENTRKTAEKDLSLNIDSREIARANRQGEKQLGYKLAY